MHYDGTLRGYFSRNPIMKDKKTGLSIGLNTEMSPLDIQKLNQMYPCGQKDPICGDQDAVTTRQELDLCRDNLIDERKLKEKLEQELQDEKRSINILENENENLRNQGTSDRLVIENLRNSIRQLERQMNESSIEQSKLVHKVRDLTDQNEKLQKTLLTCLKKQQIDCEGPIIGKNGLSLLKKQSVIEDCKDYGIYDEPEKTLLIFDELAAYYGGKRAIMTRGSSTYFEKSGEGYKIGNNDKIITRFGKYVSFKLSGSCGVTYQGLMHIFGGMIDCENGECCGTSDCPNQHIGFDIKRKMVKYKDLEVGFWGPKCSTFKILKSSSQSAYKEVVLLCFAYGENCYEYDDGKLTQLANSNESHSSARLGKYKNQLITVGNHNHEKTEILDQSHNGQYTWTLGPNYHFSPTGHIFSYSMVNIPQIGSNEEYLLLIGGKYSYKEYSDQVHKYNGQWSLFGNLQNPRAHHNSVFLNGQVLIIGGSENLNDQWIKTEIWDTSKSSFETQPTWPELKGWYYNHAFTISDYINPK